MNSEVWSLRKIWPPRDVLVLGVFLSIAGCAAHSQGENTNAEESTEAACPVDEYAANHPYSAPQGMPSDWDPSIPIPSGANVSGGPETHGGTRTVDLAAPGHGYQELIDFYTDGLGKAGYSLGKPVETSGRQYFNLSFSACGRLDTVTIASEASSPASVLIVYEPKLVARKGPPNPVDVAVGLYAQCSFGDSDACAKVNAMNAKQGGITTGIEHDAIIQEQLKSPEQRRRDLDRTHGIWGEAPE